MVLVVDEKAYGALKKKMKRQRRNDESFVMYEISLSFGSNSSDPSLYTSRDSWRIEGYG